MNHSRFRACFLNKANLVDLIINHINLLLIKIDHQIDENHYRLIEAINWVALSAIMNI